MDLGDQELRKSEQLLILAPTRRPDDPPPPPLWLRSSEAPAPSSLSLHPDPHPLLTPYSATPTLRATNIPAQDVHTNHGHVAALHSAPSADNHVTTSSLFPPPLSSSRLRSASSAAPARVWTLPSTSSHSLSPPILSQSPVHPRRSAKSHKRQQIPMSKPPPPTRSPSLQVALRPPASFAHRPPTARDALPRSIPPAPAGPITSSRSLFLFISVFPSLGPLTTSSATPRPAPASLASAPSAPPTSPRLNQRAAHTSGDALPQLMAPRPPLPYSARADSAANPSAHASIFQTTTCSFIQSSYPLSTINAPHRPCNILLMPEPTHEFAPPANNFRLKPSPLWQSTAIDDCPPPPLRPPSFAPWLAPPPTPPCQTQHILSRTTSDDSPPPPLRQPSFHSLARSGHASVRNTTRLLSPIAIDDALHRRHPDPLSAHASAPQIPRSCKPPPPLLPRSFRSLPPSCAHASAPNMARPLSTAIDNSPPPPLRPALILLPCPLLRPRLTASVNHPIPQSTAIDDFPPPPLRPALLRSLTRSSAHTSASNTAHPLFHHHRRLSSAPAPPALLSLPCSLRPRLRVKHHTPPLFRRHLRLSAAPATLIRLCYGPLAPPSLTPLSSYTPQFISFMPLASALPHNDPHAALNALIYDVMASISPSIKAPSYAHFPCSSFHHHSLGNPSLLFRP
ncbi:hypothetical protein C8R43DRAFT_1230269 [Mycena crocata]|nr:hypothetical protein C8R43DRAFT_1230269 [Mycena crocata]